MAEFKDYFSGHAATYVMFRPEYPQELYRWIRSQAPEAKIVWDCGTGNGQAAKALADYFPSIVATDASDKQISSAPEIENVSFRVAPAEASGLEENSVDLVTVAQALHWFDHERFFSEVRRVLKPGGLVVVWCYEFAEISPQIDKVVRYYYDEVIGKYWPPERKWVESGYSDLEFPFKDIQVPEIRMSVDWSLEQLEGYLMSWSATHLAANEMGKNPLDTVHSQLREVWVPKEKILPVVWPLRVRAGHA